MGEVIYLYPDRFGVAPGGAAVPICLNYRPHSSQKKSWIYEMAPELCGSCREYLPDQGRCGKLPFRRECVCVGCGGFVLDRPGTKCTTCGQPLAAIAAPSDW
jgi:hypothetical protein